MPGNRGGEDRKRRCYAGDCADFTKFAYNTVAGFRSSWQSHISHWSRCPFISHWVAAEFNCRPRKPSANPGWPSSSWHAAEPGDPACFLRIKLQHCGQLCRCEKLSAYFSYFCCSG